MPSTRLKAATYRLEPEILAGLEAVRERDGIPRSEQVRRALRAWLDSKGVKADRKPTRAGRRRGDAR